MRLVGIHRGFIAHCYRRGCPAVALQSRVLQLWPPGSSCGPPSAVKLVTSGWWSSPLIHRVCADPLCISYVSGMYQKRVAFNAVQPPGPWLKFPSTGDFQPTN